MKQLSISLIISPSTHVWERSNHMEKPNKTIDITTVKVIVHPLSSKTYQLVLECDFPPTLPMPKSFWKRRFKKTDINKSWGMPKNGKKTPDKTGKTASNMDLEKLTPPPPLPPRINKNA